MRKAKGPVAPTTAVPLAEAAEAAEAPEAVAKWQPLLFHSTCMPALATQALLASLHGGQDAASEKGRGLASEPLHASQLSETLAECGLCEAKGPAAPTTAVPLAEAAEAVAKAQPLN